MGVSNTQSAVHRIYSISMWWFVCDSRCGLCGWWKWIIHMLLQTACLYPPHTSSSPSSCCASVKPSSPSSTRESWKKLERETGVKCAAMICAIIYINWSEHALLWWFVRKFAKYSEKTSRTNTAMRIWFDYVNGPFSSIMKCRYVYAG